MPDETSSTPPATPFPASWGMTPRTGDPSRFDGFRPPDGGDGYDFMADHAEPAGLRPIASWGRDGWDLGDWPYYVIYSGKGAGAWWTVSYIEGDIIARRYATRDEMISGIDAIARDQWERDPDRGPKDIDGPEARGPFSWARLEQEREAAA